MIRMFIFVVVSYITISSQAVFARTISTVSIPESIEAQGDRPSLKLNGAAVRTMYQQVDSYIGALYLEKTTHSTDEILADPGFKRMVLHIMLKRISPNRISDIFYEYFAVSLPQEQLLQLAPKIKQLSQVFDVKLLMGDQVILDFVPQVGTRIFINDELKGEIEGSELYHALLLSWIGQKPVTREFKNLILGLGGEQTLEGSTLKNRQFISTQKTSMAGSN